MRKKTKRRIKLFLKQVFIVLISCTITGTVAGAIFFGLKANRDIRDAAFYAKGRIDQTKECGKQRTGIILPKGDLEDSTLATSANTEYLRSSLSLSSSR